MAYFAGTLSRRRVILSVLHAVILLVVVGTVEKTLQTHSMTQNFGGMLVDPLGNPIPALTLIGVALFYLKTGVPGITKVPCHNCEAEVAPGRLHCRNCGEVTNTKYFLSEFAWLIIGYSFILAILGSILFVVGEETGVDFFSSTLAGAGLFIVFFGWILIGGVSLFTFGFAHVIGLTYIVIRS